MNEQANFDERVAFICAEYAELSGHVRTALTVLWQAFNIYFVMNTLLASVGGFLFLQTDESKREALLGLGLIALLGILISIASVSTVLRFIKYFGGLFERGKVVEETMDAATLKELQRLGAEDFWTSAPAWTVYICIAFFLLWGAVLTYSALNLFV